MAAGKQVSVVQHVEAAQTLVTKSPEIQEKSAIVPACSHYKVSQVFLANLTQFTGRTSHQTSQKLTIRLRSCWNQSAKNTFFSLAIYKEAPLMPGAAFAA